MARAFDPAEKLRIHETLLETGCRQFGLYGFSKTNVESIAGEAGIAKGTFYQFWNSKEAFFFACLEETELKFQEEIIEPLLSSGRHPAEILGSLVAEALKAAENYPIITQALDQALMNRLVRNLPPEILARHQEKDRGEFSVIVSSWDPDVFDPGIAPEVLDGLFKGIIMMSLNKDLIGKDIFTEVSEVTSSILSAGLKSISDRRIAARNRERNLSPAPGDKRSERL